MKTEKIYKLFKKEWSNIETELKIETKEKIQFTADITAKKYFDDGIFVKATAYASGTVHVFFTFDRIDESLEVYQLINTFNDNNSWFKAYIMTNNSGVHFLELHFVAPTSKNEAEAADNLSFAFNKLLSDSTIEDLKPLTEITY